MNLVKNMSATQSEYSNCSPSKGEYQRLDKRDQVEGDDLVEVTYTTSNKKHASNYKISIVTWIEAGLLLLVAVSLFLILIGSKSNDKEGRYI